MRGTARRRRGSDTSAWPRNRRRRRRPRGRETLRSRAGPSHRGVGRRRPGLVRLEAPGNPGVVLENEPEAPNMTESEIPRERPRHRFAGAEHAIDLNAASAQLRAEAPAEPGATTDLPATRWTGEPHPRPRERRAARHPRRQRERDVALDLHGCEVAALDRRLRHQSLLERLRDHVVDEHARAADPGRPGASRSPRSEERHIHPRRR